MIACPHSGQKTYEPKRLEYKKSRLSLCDPNDDTCRAGQNVLVIHDSSAMLVGSEIRLVRSSEVPGLKPSTYYITIIKPKHISMLGQASVEVLSASAIILAALCGYTVFVGVCHFANAVEKPLKLHQSTPTLPDAVWAQTPLS